MGVVDTVMAGRLGSSAVAALSLANTSYFFCFILGMGALMGIDPIVSQAVGAQHRERWEAALVNGRWLALILCIPLLGLLALTPMLLGWMGQPEHLLGDVAIYLGVLGLSIAPSFLYLVSANYLSAHNQTHIFLRITLIVNIVNLAGNAIFIHGWFGLPTLGVLGIAVSTAIAQVTELLCVLWLVRKGGSLAHLEVPWRRPDPVVLKQILALGLPVGVQYMLEFSGFGGTTLLMGLLGEATLAGHQVALNVASLTFTVALGISSAASIRVGQAYGRRDLISLRTTGQVAWQVGVVLSLLYGVVFIIFGEAIARLYVDDPATVAVGASLLTIAAAFQLADTAQAIGFGLLRGLGDTRVPVIFNAVGYWLIGMPLGYLGSFVLSRSPEPLWWGLTLALTLVAIALVARFFQHVRRLSRAWEQASVSELKHEVLEDAQHALVVETRVEG